jgi:hypothetical protein
MAPKADTAANPTGPQLHAPALAPIIVPKRPVPDFFIPFPNNLTRYILKLMTRPDRAAIITIREN